jgi:hypothetical protein
MAEIPIRVVRYEGGYMNTVQVTVTPETTKERPGYVQPRVQVMSETDILNTFQITQAMQTWWTVGC